MNILITGGCGFIGSHMAAFHVAKGDIVQVVDNLTTGSLTNIASFCDAPGFTFETADLLTWPKLATAVQWADRIYHFAAVVGLFKAISEPIDIIYNNINGCEHLLRTIAQTGATPLVIVVSSSSVYGNNPNHLLNEADDLIIKVPTHPLATYTISKLSDEAIALAYYQMKKIPIILPRLFNTIGPRQTGRYGMVVPRFVQQACRNEPLTIFGDGTQTRSFCDVRDSIVALDLLANQPAAIGQIINVGNDREISINALADVVSQSIGHEVPRKYISYAEAYGVDYTDITQRRPDIAKLKDMVPFKHQWTLEATVADLIEHYLHYLR